MPDGDIKSGLYCFVLYTKTLSISHFLQTTLQPKHQVHRHVYYLNSTPKPPKISGTMQSSRSTARPSSPSAVRASGAGRSRPSCVEMLQKSAFTRRPSSPSFVSTSSAAHSQPSGVEFVHNGASTGSPPRAAFTVEPTTPSTLGTSDASVGPAGKSPDSSIRSNLKRVGLGRAESSNSEQKKQRSENNEPPNILLVNWEDIDELKSIASIQVDSSDVSSDIEELVLQVLQNYTPQQILCAAMRLRNDILHIPNSRKDKEALVVEYVKSLHEQKVEENNCKT